MKKLILILIAAFTFATCYAQKHTLSLNLEKGRTYTQKMTSNSTIVQSISGQQLDTKITIIGMIAYQVIDIQNAVYDMEVSYKSLAMNLSLPTGSQQYSSDKTDESDIMSTILRAMIDQPFVIKLSKTGTVLEVKNIESLFAHMFDKFPQLSEAKQQQLKTQLMQSYGDKAFKGNLEMCLAIFPDLPVAPGDSWRVYTQLESGMAASLNTTYTLKEMQESTYRIGGTSEMKTADKDAYVETNGMPLRYDMAGTMLSEIKVDKKTGWVIESLVEQEMDGTAYILDNPGLPGGMEIPMTLSTRLSVTEK